LVKRKKKEEETVEEAARMLRLDEGRDVRDVVRAKLKGKRRR
jgi:hypothetical protein